MYGASNPKMNGYGNSSLNANSYGNSSINTNNANSYGMAANNTQVQYKDPNASTQSLNFQTTNFKANSNRPPVVS